MKRIQWVRRLYHLAGIFIVAIYLGCFEPEERWSATLILAGFALLPLGFDLIKWRSERAREWLLSRLSALARPSDLKNLNSSSWYLLGCTLTIAVFDMHSAAAGIMILALGDNAASIIGIQWGRHRIGEKSLEGTCAFVIVGWLSALPFVSPIAALVGALFGALAELLLPWVDDNFTVPLCAALGCTLVSFV